MRKDLLFTICAVILIAVLGYVVNHDPYRDIPHDISGLIVYVEDKKILIDKCIEDADIPNNEWVEADNWGTWFTITCRTVRLSGGEVAPYESLTAGKEVKIWLADERQQEDYGYDIGEVWKVVIEE